MFDRGVPHLSGILIVRHLDSLVVDGLHGGVLDRNHESAVQVLHHWTVQIGAVVHLALEPVLGVKASRAVAFR